MSTEVKVGQVWRNYRGTEWQVHHVWYGPSRYQLPGTRRFASRGASAFAGAGSLTNVARPSNGSSLCPACGADIDADVDPDADVAEVHRCIAPVLDAIGGAAKAEAPLIMRDWRCEHGLTVHEPCVACMEDPVASCAPGCNPAAPCRTEDVCPVWREPGQVSDKRARLITGWAVWQSATGIDADPLLPYRPHAPPALRHEGIAGFGSWNGRAGK